MEASLKISGLLKAPQSKVLDFEAGMEIGEGQQTQMPRNGEETL